MKYGFNWNNLPCEGSIEHLKLEEPFKLRHIQVEQILHRFTIGTLEIYARPFRRLLNSNYLPLLMPKRLVIHINRGDLLSLWNEVSAVINDETRRATRSVNVEEVEFIFYRNEPYTQRAVGIDEAVTCGVSTWTNLEAWLGSLVRRLPDRREYARSRFPTNYSELSN